MTYYIMIILILGILSDGNILLLMFFKCCNTTPWWTFNLLSKQMLLWYQQGPNLVFRVHAMISVNSVICVREIWICLFIVSRLQSCIILHNGDNRSGPQFDLVPFLMRHPHWTARCVRCYMKIVVIAEKIDNRQILWHSVQTRGNFTTSSKF